ncbi:hypothetical protein CONLIGDRAFT_688063 [Coniochaeta ligniaria NRRL 30616]|uniref:Ecp2 effector protein-like domain-containing protein n=1 Tax=Coniochaeta ligniaria NRRL 30616 TaxID=1408157 RepID=A0A1J7JY05_9PEZI|nr:hypothetical protein CONLIGDRAFT_688063 [Coniochaeta ligniaria NRRL 30616]
MTLAISNANPRSTMHKSMNLAALALSFASSLGSPLPQISGLVITQGNGLNYTSLSKHDTSSVHLQRDDHPDPDCPKCGADGQPPLNNCGDSTFEDHTSDASPLAADCLHIAKNIDLGGRWHVAAFLGVAGGQHQLVEWGTCAFGVEPVGYGGTYDLGNLDIIDLIDDSVNRFAKLHGGKVGSAGEMRCFGSRPGTHNNNGLHGVRWGIYHTK